MADKEAGLNISVGAEADVDSAKKAAQDLTKGVLSSLKDGYIEVPAEIKVPIKNASKELEQAQKDVLAQWKKTFKEGFSSSAKDLDDLTEAFRKFKRLAGKEHKAGSKQYKEISKLMSEQIQSYNTQKQARDAKVASHVAKLEETRQRKTSNKRQKGYIGTGAKITNENIEGDIKAYRKRQLKGIRQVLPNGYGSGWVNASNTNDYASRRSELSFYGSKNARQTALSQIEARRTFERESLTSDKYATKQELEAEVKARRAEDKKTATHYIEGKNKNNLSSIEKAKGLSEDIRKNILPQLIDKLQTAEKNEEITPITQKIFDTIDTISAYSIDAGKLILTDVKQTLGIVMGKLGFTTSGKIGGIDAEEGTDKTALSRNPKIEAVIKGLLDKVAEKEDAIKQELIELEELEKSNKTTRSVRETNNFANRIIAETRNSKLDQKRNSQEITQAITKGTRATETQTSYDKIENISERQADIQLEGEQKETTLENRAEKEAIQSDASTGFNTAAKADELINEQSDLKRILGSELEGILGDILKVISALGASGSASNMAQAKANLEGTMCPCQSILDNIFKETHIISVYTDSIAQNIKGMAKEWGVKEQSNLPALVEGQKAQDKTQKELDKTNIAKIASDHQKRMVEEDRKTTIVQAAIEKYRKERAEKQEMYEKLFGEGGVTDSWGHGKIGQNNVTQSRVTTSPFQYIDSKAIRAIRKAFGVDSTRRNAQEIASMTQSEQEKLRADRINRFGLTRGRRDTDTGDIAQVYRTRKNFGWGKQIENPFANLNLSEGINIDTTAITEALQNAIQENMFNSQTGGILRNIVGPMTLYAGQPSLEKSRAEADAANQVMAEIRSTVQNILNDIQAKETDLKGMEASGKAVFENGKLVQDNSRNGAATKLFADLEDQKAALRGVLADVGTVNEVVEQTGGNVSKIFKQLGFAAPELRKCNTIIQNINAGLDKNGKALKFQTRTAEVMNYSFQLMSRSIGQMIKRWISMLNPINLLKRAFSDFASYDVKWQRTLNVIKYNIRRIIKPAISWIAQQIVNIIGLVNALMKGIGSAFGQNWDLFDQSAANTEKMAEDFEKINNVTASFDELHDIAGQTNSTAENDLMGDIYTPQWKSLYEGLEEFGKKVGGLFKGLYDLVKDWTFWDWLKLAGAALAGYVVLKWLLSIFGKGKNPLQTVAEGFKFLEKAVGWALLIWAFTAFTKALTDFVDCMKSASWEDIAKSLVMLGGAFVELIASIAGIEGFTKLFGTSAGQLFGLSALVGVFKLFVDAIIPFIECIKDLGDEKIEVIAASLITLAGAFVELVAAIAGIEGFTKLFAIDWAGLFGLAAVVAVFSLFVRALVPFLEAIKGMTSEELTGGLIFLAGALTAVAFAIGVLVVIFTALVSSGLGIIAIILLGIILAVVGLVIEALADLVEALKDAGDDIKLICEGIAEIVRAVGEVIIGVVTVVGITIVGIITALLGGIASIIGTLLEGIAEIIRAMGEVISGIVTAIAEGISTVVSTVGGAIQGIISTIAEAIIGIINSIADAFKTVGETICQIVETIAEAISTTVTAIAEGIKTILEPILEFVDSVIEKIVELATTIVREIGETIRSVVKTVGEVILGIIESITDAIPKLLKAIVEFCEKIGPAIEKSADSIMRTVTKIVNFIVSAIEYLVNLVIDGVNGIIGAINSLAQYVGLTIPRVQKVSIPRFVPQYERGTNFVPNSGLAYLHKGEAVIPAKYNQGAAYQPQDTRRLEDAIYQLNNEVRQIGDTVYQGIPVKGEFRQRGSDLVAVVQRADKKLSNNILSNKTYAR